MLNNLLTSPSGIILDAVLVIILLVFTVIGFKMGFVKAMVGLFGGLFAFVLACAFCTTVYALADLQWGIGEVLIEWMHGMLSKIKIFTIELNDLEDTLHATLSDTPIPTIIVDRIVAIVEEYAVNGHYPIGTTLASITAPTLGSLLGVGICWLAIFLGLILLQWIVVLIFRLAQFDKSSFIVFVNRFFGAVGGCMFGIMILMGVCAVIALVQSERIDFVFSNAFIGDLLYNHNFLVDWLSSRL